MARIHAFRAGTPNLNKIEDLETFFDTCKASYVEQSNQGLFDIDDEEAIFLYQIERGDEKQTGLLCTLDMKDYLDGKVIPHENTLAAKRKHMHHLFNERGAHIKPTLLTFPAKEELKDLIIETRSKAELVYKTQYLEEAQRVRKISDKD